MSTPALIWLEDENGSPIVGSCMMPTRLGSIELNTVMHNITIPVEQHTGRLTATGIHVPISVQKEFDRTKPVLLRNLRRAHQHSFCHPHKAGFTIIPLLLKSLLTGIQVIKDLFNNISDTRAMQVRSRTNERYVTILRHDQ